VGRARDSFAMKAQTAAAARKVSVSSLPGIVLIEK
jgi:hypothetical protein